MWNEIFVLLIFFLPVCLIRLSLVVSDGSFRYFFFMWHMCNIESKPANCINDCNDTVVGYWSIGRLKCTIINAVWELQLNNPRSTVNCNKTRNAMTRNLQTVHLAAFCTGHDSYTLVLCTSNEKKWKANVISRDFSLRQIVDSLAILIRTPGSRSTNSLSSASCLGK